MTALILAATTGSLISLLIWLLVLAVVVLRRVPDYRDAAHRAAVQDHRDARRRADSLARPAQSPGNPMTAKILIAIAMSGTLLTFCTGCATRPEGPPMSKEQIKLEREQIVAKREERKDRWWAFAETVGKAGVNVGVTWLQAWLAKDSDGLSKDR